MRLWTALALLLLLPCLAFAGFSFSSLGVTIYAKEDGSAHVREDMRLFIDEKASIEIYDAGIAITNDIGSWKVRTNVGDVRHHLDRNHADIRNIIIRPQPRDTCNSFANTCYATLTMEYDVYPLVENGSVKNGTGLFTVSNPKPRTFAYELNSKALSFETTQTGEIVLLDNQVLTIKIPQSSTVTLLDPLPPDIRDRTLPFSDVDSFSWRGRTTLADFKFRFQREQPLSQEVIDFFGDLELKSRAFLFSLEGAAFIAIAAIAAASYILLRRRE